MQGTWLKIGSFLPQTLISNHCGKPLRGNRNENKQETWTYVKLMSLLVQVPPLPGVSGWLLCNGPGKFEIGDIKHTHWFDGLALLHSFTIASG